MIEAIYSNWTMFVRHLFTEWIDSILIDQDCTIKKWVRIESWKIRNGLCILTLQLGQMHN